MTHGKNEGAIDQTDTGIVHIERGPWDIDIATVTDVQELAPSDVLVTAGGATYRLTREEAAPFLTEDL